MALPALDLALPELDMARPNLPPVSQLVTQACHALGMSQAGLGRLVIASRKTVGRWQAGRSKPSEATLHQLARAVYATDPDLAANLATAGFATLAELGIAASPPPLVKAAPSARLVGNILVCAAAEVADASPRAMRPALVAALSTAKELGLTLDEAILALQGDTPKASVGKTAKGATAATAAKEA